MSQQCQFERVGPGLVECRVCHHRKSTHHPPERVNRTCSAVSRQIVRRVATTAPAASDDPDWWPKDADGNLIPQAEITAADMPCPHRGAQIENPRVCDQCGQRGQPFDLFACTKHDSCSLTLKHSAVANCLRCPTRVSLIRTPLGTLPVIGHTSPATTATPADVVIDVKPVVPVAVVISCHNYGRFLGEAIESVLAQTVQPAEIVVVDDRSTDNTEPIARFYEDRGVGYVRIDNGSELRTRLAGMRYSTAPWIVFLDADDALSSGYVETALRVAREGDDPAVAAVGSDFELFGDITGTTLLAPRDIRHHNWLHAGSLVRRTALESTRALEVELPADALKDWSTWRTLAAAGWKFRKQNEWPYRYRKHGRSMTADRDNRGVRYYDLAYLAGERVTVATLVGGRDDLWKRVAEWHHSQTWPARQTAIVMHDASGRGLDREIRQALSDIGPRETSVATIPADPTLPTADRRDNRIAERVRRQMPRLYAELFRRVATEYVLVLEDDVLPPLDVIDRLMRHMAPDVALVGAAYKSRWSERWVAWDGDVARLRPTKGTGVEAIGGTGFGCAIVRRSVVERIPFRGGGTADYDVEFCRLARGLGFRVLLDWDTVAEHGATPVKWDRLAEVANDVWIGSQWTCNRSRQRFDRAIHIKHPGAVCECRDQRPEDFVVDATEGQRLGLDLIKRIAEFARQPGSLFIHCGAGQCRSPLVATVALVARGMDIAAAQEQISQAMLSQYRYVPRTPEWFAGPVDEARKWADENGVTQLEAPPPEAK